MLLKHFFREICSFFCRYLTSYNCFIVVWNRHLQTVKLKPNHTVTGNHRQTHLPSVSRHQGHHHLVFEFVHHEPWQGKGRDFFFFSLVQHAVLSKINNLLSNSLLTKNYVLASNKHEQFKYFFTFISDILISTTIMVGLREIQQWEEKLQIENPRFFCFLNT